jgi:hypothetical protein
MGDLIIVQKLKVKRVYERIRTVWVSGVGKEAVMEDVSDGWVVVCDDYFSFRIPGKLEPPFKAGDTIIMKLEKEI